MPRDHKIIDLAVEIRHETALAWMVHDGHRDVWLPKSLVEVSEEAAVPASSRFPNGSQREKG
jgi:hypothetical protein